MPARRLKRVVNPPAASAELQRLAASINALDDEELELEVEDATPKQRTPKAPVVHAEAPHDADEMAVLALPQPITRESSAAPSPSVELVIAEPQPPTTLSNLPDDLVGWIFTFVHLEQLCRAARPVCSTWHGLVTVVIDTYSTLLTSEHGAQTQQLPASPLLGSPLLEEPYAPADESAEVSLADLLWTISLHAAQSAGPSGPSPFAAAPAPRTPLRHRSFHRRLSLSSSVAAVPTPGASAAAICPEAAGAGRVARSVPCVSNDAGGGGGGGARRSYKGKEKATAAAAAATAAGHREAESSAKPKGKRRSTRSGSPADTSAFMAFVAAQAQLSTIDEFTLPLEAATPR